MTVEFGSYQARTHLPDLLQRVAPRERVADHQTRQTRRPTLTQPPEKVTPDVPEVVEDMLAYRDRQKRTTGKQTIRDMIEEGRRF